MNIVDIILIAAVLLIILHGYFKGFLVSVLSLARYALGIPFCYYLAKNASEPLYNALIRESVSARIAQGIDNTGIDSIIAGVRESVNEFPEALKNTIDLSFLNNISASNAAQSIMQNVVDPVVILIVKIVLFIAVVAVFFVVTSILIALVDKASKKKDAPFKDTNKFLGAALGALKAVIIIIAVAAVADFLVVHFAGSGGFIDQLESSAVITFINKFNPLLLV